MITVLETTPKKPISLIGQRAGVCWGADISDEKKNYQRGYDCIKSDHGRTFEFVSVDFVIKGYSARVMREYMRHVGGGLTCLQESTRYVNCKDFKYTTPKSIQNNELARDSYDSFMRQCALTYESLMNMGIPREDIANILPLGMHTKLIDHKNLRNLADMSHKRMCKRAYWEFRDLFNEITEALNNYSDEWKEVTSLLFKPQCQILGRCPEKKGCGGFNA